MRLSQFYKLVLKLGIERDPRENKSKIKSFADTAILYGRPDTQVSKALVGIDIESPELLLADSIRCREGLDVVISHHPEGKPYAALFEVMRLQIDILIKAGISQRLAEELLAERMREVERKILPGNHMRSVDTARLLDLPFMCVHTPADNHVYSFIQGVLNRKKPGKVKDIVEILKSIPEYRESAKESVGPRVILGNPNRSVGKVLVEMTGGTEGSGDVYEKLYKAGVRTLVCMHLSEDHFKKVKDANLNVVIAGHIASDTLGLNLLLDRIESKSGEKLAVISCSGFRRFRRG